MPRSPLPTPVQLALAALLSLALPLSASAAATPTSLRAAASAPQSTLQASPQPAGCDLIVHVDHLRNTRGKVGTIVFASPAGWPENKQKALRHGPADIVQTPAGITSTAIWKGLPPGTYAIAAIHDENSNHKLDRNFIGIPTEGFGFANNPFVGLTPPSFRKASVTLTCPSTQITIHIQYR